jgi:hypothetical protein
MSSEKEREKENENERADTVIAFALTAILLACGFVGTIIYFIIH